MGVGRRDDAGIDGSIPDVLGEEGLAELVRVETISGLNHLVALTTCSNELLYGIIKNVAKVEQFNVLKLSFGLFNNKSKFITHGLSGS